MTGSARIHLLTSAALGIFATCAQTEAAHAQSAPTAYTSATRYDALGRVTGTISADPDDTGSLPRLATRSTYDTLGNLVMIESGTLAGWQDASISPSAWSGFTLTTTTEFIYDILGRKTVQRSRGSDGIVFALTQFSYTAAGDLECTAVRMNPTTYGSLPGSACTPATPGGFGEDRITRNVYTTLGLVQKIQKGVGTAIQQDYATYTYNGNWKVTSITDARGMKASMAYDGFDRLSRWYLPDKVYSGLASTTDFEEYTYDNNHNRISRRTRAGETITFNYDQLNRVVSKIVPERAGLSATHTRDVYYGYDLRGLQTYARYDGPGGEGITNYFDGFGRAYNETKVMDGAWGLGSGYDQVGNRTAYTFADGQGVWTYYDNLNRPISMWRSDGHITDFNYLPSGEINYRARAASATFFGYDATRRLTGMALGYATNAAQNDAHITFAYNPASQMISRTNDNDGYAWTAHVNAQRDYAVNGINQYSSVAGTGFTYDANGNLTSDGSTTFTYDVENRLVSASGARNATLRYDPMGRLHEVSSAAGTTRFVWDGSALAMEYDAGGNLLRRYTHGPDRFADDPIVWDEGSAMTCASSRFLMRDYLNSVVAAADCSGNRLYVNRYDEYGIPQGSNVGRFQYTGQSLIPELGMYYYKARFYSPTLGRFMQTDPIGYADDVNLYAYVGNDPVNKNDPTGLKCAGERGSQICTVDSVRIVVNGTLRVISRSEALGKGSVLSAAQKAQIVRLEGNITKAVNISYTLNKSVTISSGDGRAFSVTGKEASANMARKEMNASFEDPKDKVAGSAGNMLQAYTTFYAKTMNEANPREQQNTVMHEAIHDSPAEAAHAAFARNKSHDGSYNKAAEGLLGR